MDEEIILGQADICKYMYGFVDSMTLRCVVELGIPDIIHSHGRPITLTEILNGIPNLSSSFDINYLQGIMTILVRRRVFAVHKFDPKDGTNLTEIRYGLTPSSKCLLKDSKFNLAPFVLLETHPWITDPWNYLGKCVQEGGSGFVKAHGSDVFKFGSDHPEFFKLFYDGMECSTKVLVQVVLDKYQQVFKDVKSIVDVGGGTGMMISEIVKNHPHIKGINFDLPHVVAEAPDYPGVEHVGGDMFVEIPQADAITMKGILHDWNDDACVKILENCKKAIPKNGKVIIIDCVLNPDGDDLFDDIKVVSDLGMRVHCSDGKERTEAEWEKLLKKGGFPRYKITHVVTVQSMIEAYPE
uniref:Reticuline-7-O-methyltransferase n=1 Tax=Eschscholzia californica TaxID=3467 RepID=Q2HWU4_ESCCA|nr:reticuline-7-O-methyltransferase [Eschscholzia californica]